jgi:NDP-sugar pyrophosphorylase family protein
MTEKNNTDRTKSPPVRPGHPGGHRGTEGGTSALILAAGLGTRFKPWTDKHPKALALVNGKTLLQRNVEYLQHYDIYNVVVNVHHFADQVKDIVDENNGWGSTIIISDESNELLETGGGMLKAKKLLDKSPFITLNVDVLTNLNLNILIEQHQKKNALVTLAVADRSTTRFLLFDEQQHLCGWRNIKDEKIVEKISVPAKQYIPKAYSGIAVFQSKIFDHIPFTGKFSLIDVFLHIAPLKKVFGCDHTGDKWVDVGRTESVAVAEELFT